MTWRARARRKLRNRVLRDLFPEQRPAFDDPKQEVLLIALPLPARFLNDVPGAQRHEITALAYDQAGRAAAQKVRERVGSSVALGKATLSVG